MIKRRRVKTGFLPIGASVSYDFYEYKLRVKNGEVKLTGNITFGIEFTPIIDGILCSILNDAVRISDFVNHHITEFELATITMGIGTQVSIGYGAVTGLMGTAVSQAFADPIEYKPQSQPFQSEDNTLIVEFVALDFSKVPK